MGKELSQTLKENPGARREEIYIQKGWLKKMIKKGWAIEHSENQGVHIDISKKQIKINKEKYWLVFETQDIIHLYGYEEEKGKST